MKIKTYKSKHGWRGIVTNTTLKIRVIGFYESTERKARATARKAYLEEIVKLNGNGKVQRKQTPKGD